MRKASSAFDLHFSRVGIGLEIVIVEISEDPAKTRDPATCEECLKTCVVSVERKVKLNRADEVELEPEESEDESELRMDERR